MAFRFRLETVFRLRRSQEQAERLTLTRIGQTLAEVDRHLAEIQRSREAASNELAEELQTGLAAVEIHLQLAFQNQQESRRQWLVGERERLAAEYAEQLQVFDRFRQKRETLEKLRDDARTVYLRERERREQQASDEWFRNTTRAGSG